MNLREMVEAQQVWNEFWARIVMGIILLTIPIWGPLWCIGYGFERIMEERSGADT